VSSSVVVAYKRAPNTLKEYIGMRDITSSHQQNELRFFSAPDGAGAGGAPWSAARSSTVIDAAFFNRPADVLARDLIGRILQTSINGEVTSGIITETAAYTGANDPQSHEYKVKKGSSPISWGPGSLYVYSTQGHTMLTVTAAPFSAGATVLVRGLEPLDGVGTMQQRSAVDVEKITTGPGNLSKALGITAAHNGVNILNPGAEIQILPGFALTAAQVTATNRKGDPRDAAQQLRFFRTDSEWVSKG
jgi:DNA-3-methyladenine glycosylase